MNKKSKKPLIIILMGLSGAGKGTQAEFLVKKFGFDYIVMGDLLRKEACKNTKLGKKINEIINIRGELVPDQIAFQLIKNKILKIPKGKNIIIDGYPRTLHQVKDLDQILQKLGKINLVVLNIKISDKTAIARLSRRLVCPVCSAIYVENKIKKCLKCGVDLIKRKDDTPERIKKRLSWAHKDLDLVIKFYKKRGVLIDINGEKEPKEVHQQIIQNLRKYL
jgi:adenylate kinase